MGQRLARVVVVGVALAEAACARRAVPDHLGAAGTATDGEPAARWQRREPGPPITRAAIALAASPPRRLVLARPGRRRALAADDLAGRLRHQVGHRRADDALAFALAMLAGADAGTDALERAVAALTSPAALVALAGERRAGRAGQLRPGDLLVFGPLDEAAATIGVVVGAHGGTIEFVYLARGVVRRGLVTPERPDLGRDPRDGRALNTIIRSFDRGDGRDARYLAGQLLEARVDRRALLRQPTRVARRAAQGGDRVSVNQ